MNSYNHDAVEQIQGSIQNLIDLLNLGDREAIQHWLKTVTVKLLPRLKPDFPLTAAICGGGSSGKSTLFNALAQEHLSPTGGAAGMNRRVLMSLHKKQEPMLTPLFEPFGAPPQPMAQSARLLETGPPLYHLSRTMPAHVALLDTPDFDTGARGTYVNRDLAQQSLETSDVLIYIFTNSNYSNRDNTDFIAGMLTSVGLRKCILVYRVYPSFTDTEVIEHAMTVARNLYGAQADDHLLGIHRADEDNQVAGGKQFMQLRPVRPEDPPLLEKLQAIDRLSLRRDFFESIMTDICTRAGDILTQAHRSKTALELYREMLQTAQRQCVQEALSHFPIDRVMKRFIDIWLASDPTHIKIMRQTGRVVELPLKAMVKTFRWLTQPDKSNRTASQDEEFTQQFELDLLTAANRMHQYTVDPEITVSLAANDPAAQRLHAADKLHVTKTSPSLADGKRLPPDLRNGQQAFTAPAHPCMAGLQRELRQRDWKTTLEKLMARKSAILDFSKPLEHELQSLADACRRQMNVIDQIRQTFAAVLNIIPATAAITYVLHTGDPVGAAGIKVKLAGLFGLKDLYALVAIPATAGLKQADRKQLEMLLGPVTQAWLNDKVATIQKLFEADITGPIFRTADETLAAADEHLTQLQQTLRICQKEVA